MASGQSSKQKKKRRGGSREWRRGTWRRRGSSTRVSPFLPFRAWGISWMSDFFHVYRDGTHFPYEVTLTRDDEDTGNVGQRYILYVSASRNPLAESSMYQYCPITSPHLMTPNMPNPPNNMPMRKELQALTYRALLLPRIHSSHPALTTLTLDFASSPP